MDLDTIPGVREAKAWEASKRTEAFLDAPRSLAGVEVVPLSLYRLAVLEAAGNAFVCGGAPSPEAVAVFLWVVSPGFSIQESPARGAFLWRLRESAEFADLAGCVRQIREFLEEMFMDSPMGQRGGGGGVSPVTSSEAVFVDLFGDAYGWTDTQTMHTPLPKLYQLLRRITLRRDPRAVFGNRRSGKLKNDWLEAQRAQAAVPSPENPTE